MRKRFHGWPEQAYVVLLELGGEPSRETRERVRRGREEQVRQPMIDLLNDLADVDPWYEDFSVWGYAEHRLLVAEPVGTVRVAGNIEIGLRFNLDGLRIQAAWWYAGGEEITRFRAAIAAHEERTRARDPCRAGADGHEILGDVMKRIPRSYAADHPRGDLLKHRSLIAARDLEPDAMHDVEPVYLACERFVRCSAGLPSTRSSRRRRRSSRCPEVSRPRRARRSAGSQARISGVSTRCSARNHASSSPVRITSDTSRSFVPSSPISMVLAAAS